MKKKKATVTENMLVMMIGMVLICAFLVVIFGAFSGIGQKWKLRQTAREYMLIMETEGYLKPEDEASLINDLRAAGLYSIDLTGTTRTKVQYGDKITLSISGLLNENVLVFAEGLSKVGDHPANITIHKVSTAKQ